MKKQSWSALLSGTNGIRSLAFAGGVALHAINVYIIITILPTLINDLNGEQYYSWVASIFIIASLIGTILATKMLGTMGPRKAYAIASLTFISGTFMCSIAPNMLVFLIGRFIQGFGSGSLLSLSYSIVRIIFTPPLWSHALSIISGMWGISTLLGPAIGGIAVQYNAWRVSFGIVGFLAVIFLFITLKVLPKENKSEISTPPLPFLQLLILTLLIFTISTGSAMNSTYAQLCGLGIGIFLLFILAKIESSTLYPMLPHKTFSFSSEFFFLYSLILIISAVGYTIELYFPLFLQELHKKDPLIAGYMTALTSFGWTCGSLSSAGASAKKIRIFVICSPLLNILGVGILLWVIPTVDSSLGYTFIICLTLFFIGISSGIVWPHLLTRILKCASNKDALRASESLTSVQLFSTALIATLTGIITNLSGLFNPGGITGMIYAAKVLLIVLIFLLCCLGIPFSLRVSHKMSKNPTGQPTTSTFIE
ncbi:MFS transporter [Bartonella sp. F02]|uniref:MFS transporter n=1 Tax=Bartonella sp. F02 TaxID=2967262 RepID=UPI0022A8E282|nr:MFS transporter [Bartonella sp. F02]MCZ2328163.1 MFS transporter [Bartonella sp. F02]